MTSHPFSQIDVFTDVPYRGNPVAVVGAADAVSDADMASFARWTNLSETTFLLTPTDPSADYRLRIFTPGGELPFAGHPTLGSCHAWLAQGGTPQRPDTIVQECAVGLVDLGRQDGHLSFAAPPLRRSGPLDDETLDRALGSLGVDRGRVRGHNWVDNGPGWLGILLDSAASVLALAPDHAAMGDLRVGVVGAHPPGSDVAFEVRAFVPGLGVREDPVTGSLNAGLAQWLIAEGWAAPKYIAGQGRALDRDGRVFVERRGGEIWVGGGTVTCISGDVRIG